MDTAKPSKRKTLSDRVSAEIRAEMGRQQVRNAALADLLGVSEMWVSRKIRGVTPITLEEVERFAEVLEVDVAALLPARQPNTAASPAAAVRTTGPRTKRHLVTHTIASRSRRPDDDAEAVAATNRAPIRRPAIRSHRCAQVTA